MVSEVTLLLPICFQNNYLRGMPTKTTDENVSLVARVC